MYYGGHYPESADVNFAEFGLSGREPLHGEFWLYDDLTREFIKSTPKFIIFPDFNGETFRVMIDQHWSQPDNQGSWKDLLYAGRNSLVSYLIMDI